MFAGFDATLGFKNGVLKREYNFAVVKSTATGGNFDEVMVNGCLTLGSVNWKPICGRANACKNDPHSIYLGQNEGYIADPTFRNNTENFPSGWDHIKKLWNGLCYYTNEGTDQSYCNYPSNNKTLQNTSTQWYFICARIIRKSLGESFGTIQEF